MIDFHSLPLLNAVMNGTSALLIVTGLFFVKTRRLTAHKACMLAAFTVSCLFLVSYLTYHAQVGTTRYPGTGWSRTIYLAILATHTPLAACVPFLAVATIVLALRGNFTRHMQLARITFPIWLYVSITGVVIYLMLRPAYGP